MSDKPKTIKEALELVKLNQKINEQEPGYSGRSGAILNRNVKRDSDSNTLGINIGGRVARTDNTPERNPEKQERLEKAGEIGLNVASAIPAVGAARAALGSRLAAGKAAPTAAPTALPKPAATGASSGTSTAPAARPAAPGGSATPPPRTVGSSSTAGPGYTPTGGVSSARTNRPSGSGITPGRVAAGLAGAGAVGGAAYVASRASGENADAKEKPPAVPAVPGTSGATMPGGTARAPGFGRSGPQSSAGPVARSTTPEPKPAARPATPTARPAAPAQRPAAPAADPNATSRAMFQAAQDRESRGESGGGAAFFAADQQRTRELRSQKTNEETKMSSPMIQAFLKLHGKETYNNIFSEAKKMKEATDDEVNAIIKGTPGSSRSKTDDISASKSAKDSSSSTSEKGGGERSSKAPETKNTEPKPESKPTIKPTDQTMVGQDDDDDKPTPSKPKIKPTDQTMSGQDDDDNTYEIEFADKPGQKFKALGKNKDDLTNFYRLSSDEKTKNEKQTMSGQDDDDDEERERQELQKKLGPGKVVLRRGERGFVGPEGKFRQLPKKSEDEKYVPSDDDEEDDRRALKSWQRLGKDEDEIAKAFYPGSRKTGEQSPEEMLSMHRAQRAARRAEEGKKKTNEGYVFGEAKGSHPDTPREKSLAALGHPKNKITHKDVLIGRGVLAKEENDEGTAGAVRRNGRDVVSPTAPGGSGYKKEGPSDKEREALNKKIEKIQKERPTNESVEFSEAELEHIAAIMEISVPASPVADDYTGSNHGVSKRDLTDETMSEEEAMKRGRGRPAGKYGAYKRKDTAGADGEEEKAEPKNLVAQNPRTYNKDGKNMVDLEHPSKPGVKRTVPAKHYDDFRSSYLNAEKPAEKQKMHDSMVSRVFGN